MYTLEVLPLPSYFMIWKSEKLRAETEWSFAKSMGVVGRYWHSSVMEDSKRSFFMLWKSEWPPDFFSSLMFLKLGGILVQVEIAPSTEWILILMLSSSSLLFVVGERFSS
jgi:hypothetical protein